MTILKILIGLFFLVSIVKSSIEKKEIYDDELAEKYYQLGLDSVQNNYISVLDGPSFYEEYEKAIHYFEKSIQANPFKNKLKVKAYLHKGFYLMANWNFSRGIDAFNKGIELDPHTYYLHFHKVFGLYKLQKYDEALETCDKLIELQSFKTSSYYRKGVLLYNMHLYNESLNYLNKAYKLNKSDEYTNLYRETVLFKLKRFEEALDLIDELPSYIISFTNEQNQLFIFNNSLNEFKYNMSCRNDSLSDCLPISLLLIKNGNYNDAIKFLNLTIEFSTDLIEKSVSLYLKANCKMKLDKFEDAEIDLNHAIELNSNMARLYTAKGYLMEKQFIFDQAIQFYNKAIEIDSKHAEATFRKGKLLLLLKKYQDEL